MPRSFARSLGPCVASLLWLAACGGDEQGPDDTDRLDPPPEGDFSITLGMLAGGASATLIEGGVDPLFVPVTLMRRDGHERAVTLSVAEGSQGDLADLSIDIADPVLEGDERDSGVRIALGVAAQPIAEGTRRVEFIADDGVARDQVSLDIVVQPTDAPDVYLLVGQSNMVGFSGDGTRQAGPGEPDEPHPRIRQLNVTGNDGDSGFTRSTDFTDVARNVGDPPLVIAQDPLHVMPDADAGKNEQYIGLGSSFAKSALDATTADVVLVPAAWSGSSFCANDNGPLGNWAVGATDPALGNDLLFERAVLRADEALQASGGILRGILWHQGESDANEFCAPSYADNLDRLARALRTRIRVDARGADARGPDAAIPFVVGTLSRGVDARGDLSQFSPPKQQIDDAIRTTPQRLPWSAVSLHDDLVPALGFPCGVGNCIHFGAAALREMGRRYHAALIDAASNPPPR